jgi:hypothetical protein
MFALIFESPKLIMMFVLFGTIIGLSQFGGQPTNATPKSRR